MKIALVVIFSVVIWGLAIYGFLKLMDPPT